MKDAHILIAAANASTRFGGEAVLPLHYYRLLRARGHHVDLVTHARNRDDLSAFFDGDLTGIHLIPDTETHKRIWRLGKRLPKAIGAATTMPLLSLVTERALCGVLRGLIDPARPTLVHVPTPVSPRTPSAIHGLGVPVIFGPMNGGMEYPPGYKDFMSRRERAVFRLGRMASDLANRLSPGKPRAAALLVANPRTAAALPKGGPAPVELVENGVDLSMWAQPAGDRAPRAAATPFRLIFLGRLVDWKAVDVTLDALAEARRCGVDVTLDILGDGDQRGALEAKVARDGLSEVVRFHGFLPQAACAAHLARADALILNSIYECGGAVVLEAMAQGLPVIASDWGGPADYLDPECGRLVSPVPRAGFAARLAEAIADLSRDPALCRTLGRNGAAKVRRDYDWDRKLDRMLEIYAQVLSGSE
jgi:glycosyltransferase involved in cell wall biosynthesis